MGFNSGFKGLTTGRGREEYLPYKKSDTTHYSQ